MLKALPTEAEPITLIDKIDAILPQTQCRQCNYPGCRPYAAAIVRNEADIDQCPPGGDEGVFRIAELLRRPVKTVNPAHGVTKAYTVARIEEPLCIGCTLCIQACPVDAIVGAAKLMHTVIAAECTGCELCIPPCPVDCIVMQPVHGELAPDEKKRRADHWRRRFNLRLSRLEREQALKAATIRKTTERAAVGEREERRAVIEAAIARVRAKKAARTS
jgi:electron transport complex protein RnfB